MKSIQNQYIDLKEGRMSQHNFMRNLRMSMPQYITNVTSFKDAVRILKNKAILNEAMGGNPIKNTIKSYLIKGYSYTEAIKLTAAEEDMDEEVLMSQYPQDAVDTEGYEDELYERYDGPSEPMGDEAYGDYYEMVGEELETIARTKYNLDEAEIEQMFENEWHSGKNDGAIEKAFKDGDEPSVVAERLIDNYINMDDAMFDDMIKRSEDELGPDKYKFNDFEGGLSEAENTNLRDPQAVAKLVADKHGAKLKPLYNEYKAAFEQYIQNIKDKELSNAYNVLVKKFQNSAINLAGDEMLEAGMEKTAVSNLLSGYGYFEDWIQDYISDLGDILKREDLNEAKKKKEPKKELHPNQIHPQELRMGIKVELEHTDDLDKAKKIALDHLAENPFYYTALKLSGVESPSAPKVKTPVEKKTRKKKEAVELVDKTNAMQKVKLKEEIDPEIEGKPSQAYLDFLARKKQGNELMQATNADGVKFSVNDRAVAPDGKEIKITGFTTGKDGKMKAMYSAGMFADVYNLDDLKKKPSFRPGVDLGASFEKFKSTLEVLVREVVNEMYDGGSEDLAAMARSSNALRYKPETQAIAKKAAESANNKEEAASLAVKLAKAKGITDSEQITHIIDLATSKFMNETFDGRDNLANITDDTK